MLLLRQTIKRARKGDGALYPALVRREDAQGQFTSLMYPVQSNEVEAFVLVSRRRKTVHNTLQKGRDVLLHGRQRRL